MFVLYNSLGLNATERNYCYMFTVQSSVRVEKKSSCDPPLLFYVL